MKKIFTKVNILRALIVIVVLFILFVGYYNISKRINGTVIIDPTPVPSNNIRDNIIIKDKVLSDGNLLLNVKNINNYSVNVFLTIELLDSNNSKIDTKNEEFSVLPSNVNGYKAVSLLGIDYSKYKITFTVEQDPRLDFSKDISISYIQNDDNIMVYAENKGEIKVENINVGILYYKGNDIVALSETGIFNVKPNKNGDSYVRFPYDKEYKNIDFDKVKLVLNNAYNYE